MHAYVTVETLTGTGAMNLTGTAFNSRLRALAEAVSLAVDRWCNRQFQPSTGTKHYSGDGGTLLVINDLASIGTLQEDDGNDGTFDVGWAAADYMLLPLNGSPTSEGGKPYSAIMVSPKSNGSQDVFLAGQRNYLISGTWGYCAVTTTAGRSLGTNLSSTATSVDLDGTVSGKVETGMTIVVGTEHIYVTDAGSAAGTAVTVKRAQNGSTAGSWGSGTAVNYYVYPVQVQEAVLVQVARLWARKDSGFANVLGMPGGDQMQIFKADLDPDVKMMLAPFRRLAV